MQAPAKSAPAGAEATPLAAVVARLAVRLAAVINAALQQLIRQLEVPNAVTPLQKMGTNCAICHCARHSRLNSTALTHVYPYAGV